MTLHAAVCNAWHRLATPASVTWLSLRSSSVTLHASVCNAWHRLATPVSAIWFLLRSSSVTLHAAVCNARHRLATPASVIWFLPRSSLVTWHAAVCNARHRLETPASVIWLSRRLSSVTWHAAVCNAWQRLATPASMIWFSLRSSLVTWHAAVCNAWHRLTTLASVILFPRRDSLITLVNGNDSAIVATHSSAIKQELKSREVTVQSSFFSILHICLNPVCVIWQSKRYNITGALLDWCEDVWLLSAITPAHGTTRLKRFGRLPNRVWDCWNVSWFISSCSSAFNVLMTSNRKDIAIQSSSLNSMVEWR